MKRTVASALVLTAILGFSFLGAQTTRIYQSGGQAEFVNLITMKDGNLMLVFHDGRDFNADSELRYMIYNVDQGRWSAATRVVPKFNASSFPNMALDSKGDIHMVYQDGNSSANREICYARYSHSEKKWSSRFVAYESPGVNSTWPRIQVEDDLIYILWCHNYDPKDGFMDICLIVNPIGAAWPIQRAERLTVSITGWAASIHPDFAVLNKKVYAIWMDTNHAADPTNSGNWKMFYKEAEYNDDAKTWLFDRAPLVHLNSTHSENEYYPALAVDPSGTVHAFYSQKIGPYFHMMKKPGGNWTAPMPLSRDFTTQNFFPYMRYHDGLIHAIWNEGPEGEMRLLYNRALPNGTWGNPIVIASPMYSPWQPWLAIDKKGVLHIVWADGPSDSSRDIYHSKVTLPGNPPTAVIDASPTRGLIPLSVRFEGTRSTDSDGTIIKYMWDFGDGNTAEGQVVTHTYTQKGTFKAVLKVLDNDFRVGLAEVAIEASTGEPFAVIKPSATQGVVPFQVQFDGSGSFDEDGQVVSHDWVFCDGTTATGPFVTKTYDKGGQYYCSLTVTDNDGKTNTVSATVTAYQKPTAAFTATPTRGLTPLQVQFDASESTDEDGQIVTFQWSFGDGLYGSGKTVTHTYTKSGPFTAQLTVIDNDGYVDITEMTIDALSKPLAPTQVAVKTDVNRTLLYRDYFNRISWQENTRNAGLFAIAQYRIYRKLTSDAAGQFVKVGEVSASQFHFDDRKHTSTLDAARYEYVVTAVDNQGRESGWSLRVSTGGNS
ncbi:MAG: PKD domain-containing protein [Acidobacteriota bacterium]|nr:PKD domain-containing protein [Acidobacteriota bacterium]